MNLSPGNDTVLQLTNRYLPSLQFLEKHGIALGSARFFAFFFLSQAFLSCSIIIGWPRRGPYLRF